MTIALFKSSQRLKIREMKNGWIDMIRCWDSGRSNVNTRSQNFRYFDRDHWFTLPSSMFQGRVSASPFPLSLSLPASGAKRGKGGPWRGGIPQRWRGPSRERNELDQRRRRALFSNLSPLLCAREKAPRPWNTPSRRFLLANLSSPSSRWSFVHQERIAFATTIVSNLTPGFNDTLHLCKM